MTAGTDPAPLEPPCGFTVDAEAAGARLDALLAKRLTAFSRSVLRRAIDAGHVTVDGERRKPSHRLEADETVRIERLETPPAGPEPEAIPLDFLYEDDDLVAVNKPAGMIVHPAKGHWAGTLASALAHHFGEGLSTTGGPTRPGIVHRLDRDTSGVIVVAKHDRAHERISAQFAARTTEKEYLALVLGVPDRDADVIDEPIGPHPHVREKMAIRRDLPDARPALTTYEVVERFITGRGGGLSLLRARPKTGRTHQIRVHLAHVGCPVLCDKQYGGRTRITATELSGGLLDPDEAPLLERQALHAHRLRIDHPTTGERITFEAPLPADIDAVLHHLRGVAAT